MLLFVAGKLVSSCVWK